MFCVLGEGRGHMTQSIAVKQMLEAAGHQVVAVTLGVSSARPVPAFFAAALQLPVTQLPTPGFRFRNHRSVSALATLGEVLWNLPRYFRLLRQLDALVAASQPDVILNFFEPLAALYGLTRRRRPPLVAVGHQFMFLHPAYLRPPKLWKQRLGLECYSRLLGVRAVKLALSLYAAPDRPAQRLIVGPPILRAQLFQLPPAAPGDFVLVYLLNHGYAEPIIEWSRRHPATRLHCFYDKPGAPPEEAFSPSLTFHRLDGEKFLRYMAACRHVVSTAGFESVSEAAWLGKPMFLVPVEGHIEQQLNALDAQQFGVARAGDRFDLDRLAELPPSLPTAAFRAWVDSAARQLFAAIDLAVRERPPR